MKLILQYDELGQSYRVRTGDHLTTIAKLQNADKAGLVYRDGSLPIRICSQFSLGTGLNGQLEFYSDAAPSIDRRISTTQAQVLQYLLDGGAESLVPTTASIYSRAMCIATQSGITDIFGLASALHLIAPSINGQLRELATEIESTLPFMRCSLTTQLDLAPAMSGQVAALDQSRMSASVEIAKIALTTPLDVEEEMRLRLEHMKETLDCMANSQSTELPDKLTAVSKQMATIVLGIRPEVRQQMRLPERRASRVTGLMERILKLITTK